MNKIRKFLLVLLIIFSLLLVGCSDKNEEVPKEEVNTYTITYYLNGIEYSSSDVEEGKAIVLETVEESGGIVFYGWYTDSEYTNKFDSLSTDCDLVLYGYYETGKCRVKFETNCDTKIDNKVVNRGSILSGIPTLEKDGYNFGGWFRDEGFRNEFNVKTDNVSASFTLYAKWILKDPAKIKIKFVSASDGVYANKDEIYEAYYSYFYDFLVEHTDCNLDGVTKEDFLVQGKTWTLNGRSDMYHFGDRYSRYYLSGKKNGTLEEQPETSFLGYCYKNGKFIDLINHLEEFFAYWRTDEGYTGSASDPDNTGNDFYIGSWAAMVDTAKFFYFTADTLQDKYVWFTSERVKYALDHIPNVMIGINNEVILQGSEYILTGKSATLSGESVNVKFYLDKECTIEIYKLNEAQTSCDECEYKEVYIKIVK